MASLLQTKRAGNLKGFAGLLRHIYMDFSNSLPIFPLGMMPLPGEVVALHIFEPRYREMIQHCRDEPNSTGDFVMQYEEGERSCGYATAMTITKILHEHEDGRVDLLAEGKRRVEVLDRVQFHLYHSACTRDVEDERPDWDNDLASRVYALHRQLLFTVTGDEPADSFYQCHGGISFKVGGCAGLTFQQRLHLLRSRSEDERLEILEAHLREALPELQRSLEMARQIAGTFTLDQAGDDLFEFGED